MGKSGCLLGWLIGEKGESPTSKLEVRVNTKFITAPERGFYLVLRHVVGDRAVVLMQVAMNQLLHVPRGEKGTAQAGWRNRIAQKSVDFLLVDPRTFRPLVAIELDEPSHARPGQYDRGAPVYIRRSHGSLVAHVPRDNSTPGKSLCSPSSKPVSLAKT